MQIDRQTPMDQGKPQIEKDRDLAHRVASGNQSAFDAFFKEYFPRLFRFALGRVGNDPALAEEVVQRTMCIVVRKMGSYRGEALLFTWLCQICRNETNAVYRQRGERFRADIPIDDHPAVQAALESVMSNEYQPEAAQQRREVANFVKATLQHLPGNYAKALEMKYIHGDSVREIAMEMGLSEKATESLLTRARNAFKKGFGSLWDFEPGLARE